MRNRWTSFVSEGPELPAEFREIQLDYYLALLEMDRACYGSELDVSRLLILRASDLGLFAKEVEAERHYFDQNLEQFKKNAQDNLKGAGVILRTLQSYRGDTVLTADKMRRFQRMIKEIQDFEEKTGQEFLGGSHP